MDLENNNRREREIKSTLEQINSFKNKDKVKWKLNVPLWQIAIEGISLFLLAFFAGHGLAVLYKTVFL